MSSSNGLAILLFLALKTLFSINAQSFPCDEGFSFASTGKNVTKCKKLGTLGAELGWNYYNGSHNKTIVDILFGVRLDDATGWVAWGVNPRRRPHMVGTRAFIGIRQLNGSMTLNTYNITRYTKIGCQLQPSGIEPELPSKSMEYQQDTRFLTMSMRIILPPEYNISKLNHVWQAGSHVVDNQPQMHATTLHNFDSAETLNLVTGRSRNAGSYRNYPRTVHGILNIIGWGILLPIGVIIARHFKEFPVKYDNWFRLHVSCQVTAFSLGTTGWGIGLWLGNTSKYYSFRIHRILGIFIFVLATLQVFALWLKPKKTDKYRKYWDIYHHFLGYALIALIVVNMFQGIKIITPSRNWKRAYVGILCSLASITILLEISTWTVFLLEKRKK